MNARPTWKKSSHKQYHIFLKGNFDRYIETILKLIFFPLLGYERLIMAGIGYLYISSCQINKKQDFRSHMDRI